MYLIAYDISSDKIRNKVAKCLENYGKRVQYSLFECELTKREYSKMYKELIERTENMKDGNIRIYQIDKDLIGKTVTIGDPDYVTEELNLDVIFI